MAGFAVGGPPPSGGAGATRGCGAVLDLPRANNESRIPIRRRSIDLHFSPGTPPAGISDDEGSCEGSCSDAGPQQRAHVDLDDEFPTDDGWARARRRDAAYVTACGGGESPAPAPLPRLSSPASPSRGRALSWPLAGDVAAARVRTRSGPEGSAAAASSLERLGAAVVTAGLAAALAVAAGGGAAVEARPPPRPVEFTAEPAALEAVLRRADVREGEVAAKLRAAGAETAVDLEYGSYLTEELDAAGEARVRAALREIRAEL